MQGSRKTRLAVIAVVLATATMVAASAMANRHGGRHRPGGMLGSIERGVDQLELTPENRKAADAIFDQARTQLRALRDPSRAAHWNSRRRRRNSRRWSRSGSFSRRNSGSSCTCNMDPEGAGIAALVGSLRRAMSGAGAEPCCGVAEAPLEHLPARSVNLRGRLAGLTRSGAME